MKLVFMQFAKDSFFLALQQRLAGLNPARTVTLNGATVPAVVVVENLPPSSAEPQPNTFYIEWGAADVVDGHAGNGALMSLECVISYYTLGSVPSMVDRGRVLGQLDDELLGICQPPNTEKLDYTQSPSADLGTRVFWSNPRCRRRNERRGGRTLAFPGRTKCGAMYEASLSGWARRAQGEADDFLLFGGDAVHEHFSVTRGDGSGDTADAGILRAGESDDGDADDFRSRRKWSVPAGFAAGAVAGFGMDRKLRALVRHADRCGAVGSEGAAGVAVSGSDGRPSGIRLSAVGQVADGAGGRVGAHERAGDRRRARIAGALGRNAGMPGVGGAGGIDGEPNWFLARAR